jgi:hypothetical protein
VAGQTRSEDPEEEKKQKTFQVCGRRGSGEESMRRAVSSLPCMLGDQGGAWALSARGSPGVQQAPLTATLNTFAMCQAILAGNEQEWGLKGHTCFTCCLCDGVMTVPDATCHPCSLQGILNKITPDNFERLTGKIMEVGIRERTTLEGLIDKIFDKVRRPGWWGYRLL